MCDFKFFLKLMFVVSLAYDQTFCDLITFISYYLQIIRANWGQMNEP